MVEQDQQLPDETPEQFRRRHEHHHEHLTDDQIRPLAYRKWQEAGEPIFDASITFSCWIDAESELEGSEHHLPPPPDPIE